MNPVEVFNISKATLEQVVNAAEPIKEQTPPHIASLVSMLCQCLAMLLAMSAAACDKGSVEDGTKEEGEQDGSAG